MLKQFFNTRTYGVYCGNIFIKQLSTVAQFSELPNSKGLPFVGNLFSLLKVGGAPKLHEYVTMRHKELGSIFKDKLGPIEAVFMSNPIDMLNVFRNEGKYPLHIYPEAWAIYNENKNYKRGLFFMEGEEWMHYRKIMNTVMLKNSSYDWISEPCTKASQNTVTDWWKKSKTNHLNELSNLGLLLYKWSIDVFNGTVLGTKYTSEVKDKLDPLVQELSRVVSSVFITSSHISLISARLAYNLKLPVWKRFEAAMDAALEKGNILSEKLILESEGQGNGLIEQLLNNNIKRSMLNIIICDLLLAAGDTTVHSTEWALYLLAKHKDVQEKFRTIILSEDNEKIDQFSKGIIKETLRMYPVATFLNRILPKETVIAGYKIPAGTLMLSSLYTSGHDPKYFKDPEMLVPERWFRKNNNDLTNKSNSPINAFYSRLPFALGVRSCIGRKVSEIQMQSLLVTILRNYKLELNNLREVGISLKLVITPSEDIRMSMHPINNKNETQQIKF